MNDLNIDTPVLVLNCKLGALAIMRSLGTLGVSLYGVDGDPRSPGMLSRYCKEKFIQPYDENQQEQYLNCILDIGKKIGKPTLLIPTSDELSLFVLKYIPQLKEYFLFPKNDFQLVAELISKEGMYKLAGKYEVPTPFTLFPAKLEDVKEYSGKAIYPVMLKGIYGNRLQEKTGLKMVIVRSRGELIETYQRLEDPDMPNLMLQEYIPGGDDQVYIFNGYFDRNSECLAGFTGHKIRQFPVHVGCASLGECRWNQKVADLTIAFMKAIGYAGVLDIGYRLDPRDGLYKVLDINPRVGQAFRLFVAENGMDSVRSLYLDMTGQKQKYPIISREGRRWVIEDLDLVSSLHYYKEGGLKISEWVRSFKNLEEGAWFNWKDPYPFVSMTLGFSRKLFKWTYKNSGLNR